VNFLCFTIQLASMNILFSYFTSINVFFMAETRTPHPSFGHLHLWDLWIMRIMKCTIRGQSMNSKFKLAYKLTKINCRCLLASSAFFHIPVLLIHFTPKRLNTAIFMYKRTFLLKYAILRRQKMVYQSRNKQVNTIFLIIHLSSSRKIENKRINCSIK